MLRSVVRVQSLTRGNLSFLSFFFNFLVFPHHIFHLVDNKSVSLYVDAHIICHQIYLMLLLKMLNRGGALKQKLPL